MIKKHIYLLVLLILTLSFACKKEQKGESINYTALAEERIMKVAEQPVITVDDISSLERLLEKVTDNTAKPRLNILLSGVKNISAVINGLVELKTNPEINFQDLYAELNNKLKETTDLLPRKAVLLKELEAAQANYSKEEYTYQDWVVKDAHLGAFLATNYSILPVAGKPYSFLRKDIEKIDSLVLDVDAFDHPGRIPYTVIKTLKGLLSLTATSLDADTLNLNFLKNLQRLIIGYNKFLKIDSCQQLKHLELIQGNGWGQTIDFTNKYPDLETLILNRDISPNLVTVLLPNKKHLKSFSFPVTALRNGLPNIKKLVIEAGGELELSGFTVGTATNMTINEISISGVKKELAITGTNSKNTFVTVRKLALKDMKVENFTFGAIDLSENLDLGVLPGLKSVTINSFSVNGELATFSHITNLDKHAGTLAALNLNEIKVPGGTLDFSSWQHLTFLGVNTQTAYTKDAPVRKVTVSKATFDAKDTCNECAIEIWSSVGDVEVVVAN